MAGGGGGGGVGGALFKMRFNQVVRYTLIRGSNSAIFIFHSLPNDIQFLMKRIRSLGEIHSFKNRSPWKGFVLQESKQEVIQFCSPL